MSSDYDIFELDQELIDKLEELFKNKSIMQLRGASSFLNNKADFLSKNLEGYISIDAYRKIESGDTVKLVTTTISKE